MQHTKAKILVVDDIPSNLQVMTEILSSADYQVAAAISGERALKRLESYQPHLILLDVQMPGIDGFETCRHIKANPEWAAIPIIFITALNDAENVVKGFSLGASDYISKPFREPELLARVNTHLQLQQMTQGLEQQVAERTQALEIAMAQLKKSQLQTIQSEKMATLGNLVAGVAHEVNNPLGFLKGSVENAKEHMHDLGQYLDAYHQHQPPTASVQAMAEEIDLEFVLEDFPKLLDSMKEATDRIKNISNSLRIFSRADKEHKVSANLHEGLDSTFLILKYRLKANACRPAIEVIRNYGELPQIDCFPGQLNQVFINILANAIDMFDEMAQQSTPSEMKDKPMTITVQTALLADQKAVEIRISDNGKGMAEDVKARIFDHLFTTKNVGKGTGLGLAIAHQIITETHGGTIEVISELGQGTIFLMRLPT